MHWIAERFSDSDGKDTAEAADRFVCSIPSFSETIEEVAEAIRKRLALAYGQTGHENKRLCLATQTTELINWSKELGINIEEEWEFNPITYLEIADYPKPDRKFWVRPPRTEVCASLVDIGNDRPVVDYKVFLYGNAPSKIIFTEGALRITSDHLLSVGSLLQLRDIISNAQQHKIRF